MINHRPHLELARVNGNLGVQHDLQEQIANLGERCFGLLKLYYFEKLSMRSIAEAMGFGSDRSAKTQKYKCLERARKMAETQFAHLKS